MKFLTFIFAIYILMLPCIPCADNEECNEDLKTEKSFASTDQGEHQDEDENCNPYCSCACCGQTVNSNLAFAKLVFAAIAKDGKQPFFYRNISLSSDYFGNIWQPPKLS